jgi:hypothetical protein
VAPEADLYFIAEYPGRAKSSGLGPFFDIQLTVVAQAIDRLVAINKTLPPKRQIRVISISTGIMPVMAGFSEAKQAIARAAKEGIYTVYVGSDPLGGLDRQPLADPDQFHSYVSHYVGARSLRSEGKESRLLRFVPILGALVESKRSRLLVPMDSRCTAAPTGDSDYAFYRKGGASWTVPWIAGLYALACQVRPDITPDLFWDTAQKTSVTARAKQDEADVEFGPIVNPEALLEALQSEAGSAVE